MEHQKKFYCEFSKKGNVLRDYRFKMICGVDDEVLLGTNSVAELYVPPGFAGVFQEELLTIVQACGWLGNDPNLNIT